MEGRTVQTDLQRFVALYASFSITCVVTPCTQGSEIVLSAPDPSEAEYTRSEKLDGYYGFYSRVIFDADGKFISQGFWE